MAKKTKQTANPGNKKNAKHLGTIKVTKESKTSVDMQAYDEKMIGWNFRRMDTTGQWPCTFRRLTSYRDKLLAYEGKSISEVLGMSHCHPIGCDAVCEKAQNRLNLLNISGAIMQIPIGGAARLWGILEHNIFHLVWIDPKHEVYPSGK